MTSEFNIVRKAFEYAMTKHAGQTRNGTGFSYIGHPVRVMTLVAQHITDDYLLAAALLHDVIEECGVTYENLVEEFGPVVANYVDELTNDKECDAYKTNKEEYIKDKISKMSKGVFVIKMADMLDNITDNPTPETRARYIRIFIYVAGNQPSRCIKDSALGYIDVLGYPIAAFAL